MKLAYQRDDNEADIVKIMEQAGAVCRQQHPTAGFDLLVLFRKKAHIMEVKNPKQPPSKRRLTKNEEEMRQVCESRGVKYNVVLTGEDALAVLGVFYVEFKL